MHNTAFSRPISDFVHEKPTKVPDIELVDTSNVKKNLTDYREKIVILNFWATWCKACVEEMPSLLEFSRKFAKDNVVVLPVSIDYNGSEKVAKFYKDNNLQELPAFIDPKGEVYRKLKIRVLPTTIVLDKAGNETARILGAIDWQSDDIEAYLYKLINNSDF